MMARFSAHLWLTSLSVICACVLPPRSTAPAPTPSADSAWVVFFSDQTGRPNAVHTVRDENGRMLGRVRGRGWFAVQRPPGLQWFFTGSGFGFQPCRGARDRGVTNVGALSAHLEVGRIYLVRVAAYEGARRSIASRFRDLRHGCCIVDENDNFRPDFVDLVGVRPGGAEWNRALGVLREGVRYKVAPRGLEERNVSEIPDYGRARFGQCVDVERSQLARDDGSPFWPLTPVDPSDALAF